MEFSSLSTLASSAGSLIVIFGVLIGATLLARRLRATAWAQRNGTPSEIKLIASRPLGGQNTIIIAQVQNQRFLIGLSRAGMTALGRLDGHE